MHHLVFQYVACYTGNICCINEIIGIRVNMKIDHSMRGSGKKNIFCGVKLVGICELVCIDVDSTLSSMGIYIGGDHSTTYGMGVMHGYVKYWKLS